MSKEDEAMLDYVSKKLGRSKAETLHIAVKFVHDALKF